jgi:hypothetical protein
VTPDLRTREARAAQAYMKRKGYPDARPYSVIPIEGQPCWYFYYQLPEGRLELEVSDDDGVWRWIVSSFQMWDDLEDPKHRLLAV